jgi:hypothetical protein
MPSTQGIGSEKIRKAFTGRSKVLEHGEYKSFFASRFRVGDLAPEDDKFLAQDQLFEILRARGPTGEQEQAHHLAKGDQDKTGSHACSFAAMTTSDPGATE